jgi:hypothetical protein
VTNEEPKTSPWDVFINLLAVIALYASVWAALALLFAFIEIALPELADGQIDIRDNVRYALAVLIIFFPAYVWAWREIEIDLAGNPEKRRRWLRTCPIYLTLFLAGLLALGDFSCAVYYFLTGDLTLRFILKVAAIAVVTVSLFAFYLHTMRREPGQFRRGARLFAYAACATTLIVVFVGFAIAGSPTQARQRRLDTQRLNDLAQIQVNVLDYWKRQRILPASLDKLDDDLSDWSVPKDPVSNKVYDYRATGSTSFELCADFARKDDDARHTVGREAWKIRDSPDIWNHEAGHFCFSRAIDPSRYPPGSATDRP